MNTIEQSIAYFREGFSCSQALLGAFGPALRLDRELALKLADPFGGGMGLMGGTCGAVTGAFMVIGLKYGRTRADDKAAKAKAHRLVQEFVTRFKARNATIVCRDLLGCDISAPEGMKQANEKKLVTTLCPKFVQDAAEILEEIL
jgi:C_GCAxxG_C_C family probable redox protein